MDGDLNEKTLEEALIRIRTDADAQGKRISIQSRYYIAKRHPYYPPQLPPPFVVAVSGGRAYRNRARVFATLDRLHKARRIGLLIQGNARGADRIARDWAEQHEIPFLSIPAAWNQRPDDPHWKYRAGPVRNWEMSQWRPHLWVFFPGGNGTEDARRIAKRENIKRLNVG